MSKLTIRAPQFALVALLLCALCVSSPILSALSSSLSAFPHRPKIYGVAVVQLNVSDPSKSRAFYSDTLELREYSGKCFATGATCYWTNLEQELEVLQIERSQTSEYLGEIGFWTENVKRMREYLLAKHLAPGPILKTTDGWPFFEVMGPEGHLVMFTSRALSGDMLVSKVSAQLIHAGFVVHDRAAEDRFYKDILGFHVYWHGGMKDDETNWVDMQVPDGTDWIEYMLNVPMDADHNTLGVMNHIALGVSDIHVAEQQLRKNGWKGTEQPQIGRDGKWQLNLYDPDGTRVELMEFTPVEKPCCSEYTGPHPKP